MVGLEDDLCFLAIAGPEECKVLLVLTSKIGFFLEKHLRTAFFKQIILNEVFERVLLEPVCTHCFILSASLLQSYSFL